MIQPIFSDIQPILSDTEPIFSRYSAAEPKTSTSIIDRERYSGRYLPTSASMLDADTCRCRMKSATSSAVRTARTMRRALICVASVAAAAKGGDQLYSRQLLTFGRGAQEKIMAGRVLVFGADGVGAEVCKNLALAGVASGPAAA